LEQKDVTRGWKQSFYTLDPDLAGTVSHKVSVNSCHLALGKQIIQKICCTVESSVEIQQLVLFDRPRMLQTLFIVHHIPLCSLYTMYPHGWLYALFQHFHFSDMARWP